MTWSMVWPGELWYGILYGLAGMAWYMIRPGEVWHGMCKCLCEFIALGYGPVLMWRSRCQLEVLFTRPLHACSIHKYSSCSLWAGIVNWEIVNIYHCSEIDFLWKLILVIFIKVDVESSKYKNNISCLGTTKTELFRYVSVYNFRQWPLPSSVLCEVQTELNTGCPFLFQKARAAPNKRGYLFDNAPIRHNNLGKKIQSLQKP